MKDFKKELGDRKDGKKVKDLNGMNYIMHDIQKKRNDNEVFGNYELDVTNLVKYVEEKNKKEKDRHITFFHVFATAIAKTIYNRPYLNRFIVNGKFYDRNNVSLAFTAKTQFNDKAQEVMQILYVEEEDTLNTISDKISGVVKKTRESKTSGTDDLLETVAKLPKHLRYMVVGAYKWADKHDLLPLDMTKEILYYSTAILSNLGSIGSKEPIYHHLSSFGTNSMLITMGKIFKKEIINDNGKKEIRDFCGFGITLDERIADGYYFIKSVQLLQYILDNPKLLEDRADEKIEIE
jgi:pyruvate/2-oxoglutarate dehydrogenase complex dihydrolipoamide acyltransferase (E2) component